MTDRFHLRAGPELPAEAAGLRALLRRLRDGPPADVELHPDEASGGTWLGDLDPGRLASATDVRLTLITSGTTGAPKRVTHDAASLFGSRRGAGSTADRWLLCYSPVRWAGVSVVLHCVTHGCELVAPRSLHVADVLAAWPRATHVSLTPSLFRKLLLTDAGAVAAAPLRQLTFGGEWAGQHVLDIARDTFPTARVSHVYAATETGDVCATSDGREGYPVDAMRDCEVAHDGELVVRGRRTGDLWEVRDGRLLFVGRRDELINVGGANVSRTSVESAAHRVPGVEQAVAHPVRNALLGQVVGLRYVGTAEPAEVVRALRGCLPKVAVPLKVERVAELALTSAGKMERGPA